MSDNSRRKRNRSNNLVHHGNTTSSNNPVDNSNPIASNSSNASQQMSTRRPPQSNAARNLSPFGMKLRSRQTSTTNQAPEPAPKRQLPTRSESKQQAEKAAGTNVESSFGMNLRSRGPPSAEAERDPTTEEPVVNYGESKQPAEERKETSTGSPPRKKQRLGAETARPRAEGTRRNLRSRGAPESPQPPSASGERTSTLDPQALPSDSRIQAQPIVNDATPSNTVDAPFYCDSPTSLTLFPPADHTLCLPTHPCIWSHPAKARELYAQRAYWLRLDRPLEETRRANGRLPALTDEFGERITRAVEVGARGRDANEAWDEFVRERFMTIIMPGELGVGTGEGEWRAHWGALGMLLGGMVSGGIDTCGNGWHAFNGSVDMNQRPSMTI